VQGAFVGVSSSALFFCNYLVSMQWWILDWIMIMCMRIAPGLLSRRGLVPRGRDRNSDGRSDTRSWKTWGERKKTIDASVSLHSSESLRI
jgi:hypothetical protein